MGKTTKFHPVSLHVIRGAAEYCGFKFGKIKQLWAEQDHGRAYYRAQLTEIPERLADCSEYVQFTALSDCFAADIRPRWLRTAKDGTKWVDIQVDTDPEFQDPGLRVSAPGGGGGGGPFTGEMMTCEVCGRVQKSYPAFESQWTMALVDGKKTIYWCPRCFGIPDPAPAYCARHGHDWKDRKCLRCGITPPGGGGGEYPDSGPYNLEEPQPPYCDECGQNLVTCDNCPNQPCAREFFHCGNANCGDSPHVGENWD